MTSLATLTATQAAAAIESGALTCEALVRACLERIGEREPVVHAFVALDAERTIAHARMLDRTPRRGLLHGLPIAVKDIIDTCDLPTAYGSRVYAGNVPRADASCVAVLRDAGAIVAGKTVTTEFAYFTPGTTANPADPAHTPGGSSSGSAAAVADCMVPLALGTQTAGSVTRPASYCGVFGFKPTYGRMNLTGIKPFSPSLDTLGFFSRSIDDVELLRCALAGDAYRPLEGPTKPPRIGLWRSAQWSSANAASQRALIDAAQALARDAQLADLGERDVAPGLIEAQKTVMAFEASRSLAHEYRAHRDALSPQLRELIATGLAIAYADYVAAHRCANAARDALEPLLAQYDALITASAPGEAPRGLAATGDPLFSRAWTLVGVPTISIPAYTGDSGLPVGVQVIGGWDDERTLLAIAKWIATRLH